MFLAGLGLDVDCLLMEGEMLAFSRSKGLSSTTRGRSGRGSFAEDMFGCCCRYCLVPKRLNPL